MKSIIPKKNKRIYALSFIIPVISVLIGLIAGCFAPFGTKNILTASGYSDYLPYYYEFYDRIHDGMGLGYSTNSGLGYDFTSLVAYFISDPINMLILLFPRDSIISVLNLLYMVKIGFASSFMSMFLVYKKNIYTNISAYKATTDIESDKKTSKNFVIGFKTIPNSSIIRFIMTLDWDILAFSVAYALSLFIIGVGMNAAFTGAIAIFPLIMLGAEKIIKEGRSSLIIISLTISMFCNIHISIISVIFLLLYVITRDYTDIKHFLKSGIKFIYSIVISLLCSAIIIIYSIQGGFFQSNNSLYFPSVNIENHMNSLRQLMSQGIASYISMYGKFDITVTILAILLVICYLTQAEIKISSKIKNIVLLLFVFSGTFISTTRYLFNGLNLNARNSIHFGYILCFIFLVIGFEELQYINSIKPLKVIISFIITTGIIFLPMFFAEGYDNSSIYIKTLEYLFGYFLIILTFSSKSLTNTLFRVLISILLLFEVIFPNTANIANSGNFYLSQKLDNVNSLQLYEVARKLHQTDTDSKILIYKSEESFDNPLTIGLSGYDYIVSSSKSGSFGYLQPLEVIQKEKSVVTVYIYKLDHQVSKSYYPVDIKEFKYNLQNPFESSNQLSTIYLNGKNIFELLEISVEPSMGADGSSVSFSVSLDKPLNTGYVYFNAYSSRYLLNATEINQGSVIQSVPKSNDLNIKYAYTGAVLNKEALDELLLNLSSLNVTKKNSRFFDVETDSAGYISTGYSNVKSLNFYVNNKKVSPISIINNNALVPVVSGTNTIDIRYSYTGTIIGIIAFILGIFVLIMNSSFTKKKSEKNYQKINKLINNISIICSENIVYIISVSVVLFVFILCQMITSSTPFGVYTIMKDDGISLCYPSFVSVLSSIKHNGINSNISFSTGGLQDIARYIIEYIYCIPYLHISPKTSLLFFTLYYITFFLLAPISIIFYLTHRPFKRYNKTDKRLIVYAMLYSLSSYTAVFYQYYVGFQVIALLPLIILGLELLIYKKEPGLYICLLSYFMITNPYVCFLICEFLFLYFFIMRFDSFKDFLSKGFIFAGSSILSAFVSAVSLIPFYYSTRLSPYIETDNTTPSLLKFYTSYIKQIAEYHTCNNLNTVTDNNAQTASYCGLIMLFIIPLYILNKEITRKAKIKRIALILFLFLATNNELLNYILHGFHFQTLVPNRFAIFIIFLLIITLADTDLGNVIYNRRHYCTTIIITAATIFAVYLHTYTEPSITINITFLMLGVYVITAIYSSVKKGNQHYLLYIAIVDIIINSFVVFPYSIGSKSDILDTASEFNVIAESNPDIQSFDSLTEYITDSSAYKNIGKLTSINTLSFFDSVITQGNMDYISFYNIETGSNNIKYRSNPLADMMLRIKYHITNDYNKELTSDYPVIDQINEYKLHENPNYVSFGFVTDSKKELDTIDNSQFNNSFEYQNTLSKELGGENIYNVIECYNEIDRPDTDNSVYYIQDDLHIENDKHSESKIIIPTTLNFPKSYSGKVYINKGDIIYKIGELTNDNHQISFEDYYYSYNVDNHPIIAILDEQNMSNLHSILSKNALKNTTRNKNTITVDLDSTNDGTLFISLPYYKGWNIYVDGVKTDYRQYLGGMGIDVTKGTHHIEMTYHSPYLMISIIISCVTVILIMMFYILKENRKKATGTDTL